MNNEEMQRNMEFIVSQQAQFAADIQKLGEAQVEAEARMTRIEGAMVAIVDLVGKLARSQDRTDGQLAELAAGQKRTDEALKRTDEALAETNDRLNTFITFVERYISGRQNGQQPPA
jgi:ABC-type transporter Mla subunit MlaD